MTRRSQEASASVRTSAAALAFYVGGIGIFCGVSGCGGSSAGGEPASAPVAVKESVETKSAAPSPASEGGSATGGGERGEASYYAQSLAGRPTASGEPYVPTEMTAAHRTLPFGTIVEVRRDDGRSVVVRINDRGPFRAGRVIDLSRRAAEELGIIRAGVAIVSVRVVQAAPAKAKRRSK